MCLHGLLKWYLKNIKLQKSRFWHPQISRLPCHIWLLKSFFQPATTSNDIPEYTDHNILKTVYNCVCEWSSLILVFFNYPNLKLYSWYLLAGTLFTEMFLLLLFFWAICFWFCLPPSDVPGCTLFLREEGVLSPCFFFYFENFVVHLCSSIVFCLQPVVHLEMKFPKDYPMAPPFVRVIRPRFQFLTG